MNRIAEVARVQEVCRTLWRPTPPLQHPTRRLQLWPRALRKSGPLEAPPAGLGHSRARTAASASEPADQDYSSGLASPRDEQPFEKNNSGLGAFGLQDNFHPLSAAASTSDQRLRLLLLLQPSRSLQPCPRPLVIPAPSVPRLFRLLRLSPVLLWQRATTPPVILFPRPVQWMKYSISVWTMFFMLFVQTLILTGTSV